MTTDDTTVNLRDPVTARGAINEVVRVAPWAKHFRAAIAVWVMRRDARHVGIATDEKITLRGVRSQASADELQMAGFENTIVGWVLTRERAESLNADAAARRQREEDSYKPENVRRVTVEMWEHGRQDLPQSVETKSSYTDAAQYAANLLADRENGLSRATITVCDGNGVELLRETLRVTRETHRKPYPATVVVR